MKQLIVYKGRTTIVQVSLGIDVSNDVISSEIREEIDIDSDLIGSWSVSYETDGTDGEVILTLDDTDTVEIEKTVGYMDLKRITNGEPVSVFSEPLEVLFKSVVTA